MLDPYVQQNKVPVTRFWGLDNMFRFLKATIAIGVMCAGATFARADAIRSDLDLKGVKSFHIAVSPLPIDTVDCNIDGTILGRELKQVLDRDHLSGGVDADSVAVITVISSHDPDRSACTSTVMLGAYKKASFFDEAVGWIRTGYVVMWQSAVHATSATDTHQAHMRDAVSMLADAMMEKWREANASGTSGAD